MKCIIVDDEPLSRGGLERYVNQISFLDYQGSYENALKAGEAIQRLEIDLIFLDIQMPFLNGIDFLKSLQNPPLVIFHTAFPNYALESYQLDVIDYLVKPISFERFFKAVSKANEYFLLRKGRLSDHLSTPVDYLFVKCEHRYEKVEFRRILYVEGMQNYAIIHMLDNKLITLMTLKSLEELLPKKNFFRIHKSYIINFDRVDSIEGNQVKLGQRKVPFSRTNKDLIFDRLVRLRD